MTAGAEVAMCPDPVVAVTLKYGPKGNVFLAGRCATCGRWSYAADEVHEQAYVEAVTWIGLVMRNANFGVGEP